MKPSLPEEKTKPFRLVKYFTFSSLFVILLGAFLLTILNIHWARTMQLKKSEDYALLMVENLKHQVITRFLLPVALQYGKIHLREKEQFERLDMVIRSTLHSFNVKHIVIYDMNNIISYSFDPGEVGTENAGKKAYEIAKTGKSTSRLTQNVSFWQSLLGVPQNSRLITYAPLTVDKPLSRIIGPMIGVIEIEQDLSKDYKTIFLFQIRVALTCSAIMGILFLVLLFVVRRGEAIIHQRNLERIRLKEKLEEANRLSALGEMAARISHEIRNPLGIIRSSAELLNKKIMQVDPHNTICRVIIEEATRLNSIITDFLTYARPRKLNLTPCRVEDILDRTIHYLTPQMEDQGHTINFVMDNSTPCIMADADMLHQAFLNLLINAMQSMPEGGETKVEVRSNPDTVSVYINDTGTGISADALDKIWEPFFTTKDTGTGLGLGIVKNIIGSHGGSISIKNRPIKGAQAGITLPVKKEADKHGESSSHPAHQNNKTIGTNGIKEEETIYGNRSYRR